MFENLLGYFFTQFGVAGLAIIIFIMTFFQHGETWIRLLSKLFIRVKKDPAVVYKGKDILYSKLTYWLEFRLNTMTRSFNDDCRTMIFVDVLKFWFQATKENIFKLSDENINSLNSAELYDKILVILGTIRYQFEKRCIEEKVPEIVVIKFTKWLDRNLEFCIRHIELICYSHIYENNLKKIESVYYICISVFEITLTEAEKTLKDINGELDGTEYRGCICRH
jgi:hypothetical protein